MITSIGVAQQVVKEILADSRLEEHEIPRLKAVLEQILERLSILEKEVYKPRQESCLKRLWRKFITLFISLLFITVLPGQITNIPPGGGGSGTISAGAVNDLPCYTASTTIGACSTGDAYYNSNLFLRKNTIGATSTDGLVLLNETAAAAGAQQWSPRIRLRGQGWKTDATAASQPVDWIIETVPVQEAANPSVRLDFNYSINGGAYTNAMSLLNGNVGIGTTNPSSAFHIKSGFNNWRLLTGSEINSSFGYFFGAESIPRISMGDNTGIGHAFGFRNSGGTFADNGSAISGASKSLTFYTSNGTALIQRVVINQGDVGIGTASPGVKLDVRGSAQFYDDTPTTGVTTETSRAGAGQGTSYRKSFLANDGTTKETGFDANANLHFASGRVLSWSSTTAYDGTKDIGLARNAAGVIEVNNGTAGTLRDLKLRKLQFTNDAEPTCDSTTRGTVVLVEGGAGVADTFRICTKDAGDAYAYRALF